MQTKRCGEIVDREVENSLIKRALGYNYKETKTTTENVGGIDVDFSQIKTVNETRQDFKRR